MKHSNGPTTNTKSITNISLLSQHPKAVTFWRLYLYDIFPQTHSSYYKL